MLKPKYPMFDARESAIKFLALYLKAHNPKLRAPHLKHRHGSKLHEYTECCSLVEALLGHKRTTQTRDGHVTDTTAEVEGSDEYSRLVTMWDSLGERDVQSFMPKPGAT